MYFCSVILSFKLSATVPYEPRNHWDIPFIHTVFRMFPTMEHDACGISMLMALTWVKTDLFPPQWIWLWNVVIHRTHTWNLFFDVVKSGLRASGVKQQAGLLARRGGQMKLCRGWAVAKDTSMQGGNHGDRCVRQRRGWMTAMVMTVWVGSHGDRCVWCWWAFTHCGRWCSAAVCPCILNHLVQSHASWGKDKEL